MSFNPASIPFIFKKNIPNNNFVKTVVYQGGVEVGSDSSNARVINAPNWLTVLNVNHDKDAQTISFQIRYNEAVVNNMSPGNYSANLKVKVDIYFTSVTSSALPVTIQIEEGVALSISPSVMIFNWLIGDPAPQNKFAILKAEDNWNLTPTEDWIIVTPISGIGNSNNVAIGVNPAGLTVGSYEGRVVVKDQYLVERWMAVNLNVTGQDTQTNFLYLSQENFNFISEFEEENTTQIPITIEASGDWVATKDNFWPNISETSGSAGITNAFITVDSEALDQGTLTAPITFAMGDIVKQIFITVTVLQFFTEGLESEGFYYAADRNKLSVSSIASNTYLQLLVTAATKNDNLSYPTEAPYHKGVANIVVGEETEILQKSFIPSSVFYSRIINTIKPIIYGVTANNLNKITNSVSLINGFQNLRFLKGKTPSIENKLCYIPTHITVTNTAILRLTLRADVAPDGIDITGDITQTVSGVISDGLYVYTAIINLSEFTLATGNNIVVTFGSIIVNVTIKANESEETLLAFQNEWNEYEYFNTSGVLTKTPNAKTTTTELAVEGTKHTKIVSIDSGEEYTLNTGQIYSQEEADWLGKLLDAKRVFILIDGAFIEILATTNKLQVYRTRNYNKSYTLKFKKAII